MADLTKDQLRQQNDSLFANNNSGNITAEDLRTFNDEMIDAIATEVNPSLTGSVEVEGSVSASTYYGDGSNLTGVTSEVPSGTISGSSQVDYPLISNIPSGIVSSSTQISDITGSSLVTASFASQTLTFTKGDGSTFGIVIPDESGSVIPPGTVSGSSQVVLEDTTYTDNGVDSFLQTDGAGNLSFEYVKSMYEEVKNRESFEIQKGQALFVDSNTGDRVDVYLADNSNPNRFPATLVASENISANGNGLGLISGLIANLDVGTLQSGDIVYLGTNGGWTATRPTGSAEIQVLGVVSRPGNNGAGYFINQLHTTLPNITEGNVWVGDASGVPVQVSTGSFGSSIDTGSFATTGSNTFVGDQDINGKLSVIQSTPTKFDGITEVSYPFTSSLGATGYVRQQFSNLGGAGTTFSQLVGGVDFAEFKTANDTELIFTSQNRGIRFNSAQSMNFDSATTVNVDADNGINLNNDTTINANGVVNGTNAAPGSTLTVKDGNNTPRLQVQNAILGGLTGADIVINGNLLNDGDATLTGNQTINGTNLAPGSTLTVKDGNNIPRLQVNNATLSGLAGADVVINGNLINDGDATLTGNQTLLGNINAPSASLVQLGSDGQYIDNFNIRAAAYNTIVSNWNHYSINSANIEAQNLLNLKSSGDIIVSGSTSFADDILVDGTNLAPGSTFTVKDGNNTPRLEVSNATLSGFTGTDVIVNGNLLNDGDTTITNSVIINDGGTNNNYIGLTTSGSGETLSNGKTAGNIDISASKKLTLSSVEPILFDSNLTMNGAVQMNTSLYQNAALDLITTGNTLTNQGDYFEIQLTSNAVVDVNSLISNTSRRAYILIQQNASNVYTFSITQGGSPVTVIASSGVYTSNFPAPTGTININTTLNSFTFVELIQTKINGVENVLHIRMNDSLDVGLLGAP